MKTLFGWLLGLATLVGAVYLYFSRKNKIDNLEDALEAQRLKQQIAQDSAKVAELLTQADGHAAERWAYEDEIKQSKLRVTELMTGETLEGKSGEEIAAALTAAGF